MTETGAREEVTAMVAGHFARLDGSPSTTNLVFGTASAATVARTLDEFCARRLGAPIAAPEFLYASVGSVHGLRLDDGRRVVVKVHRPNVSHRYLRAMQKIQAHLFEDGFPCPQPVLGPEPLSRGIAMVETLVDRGDRGDAHDPAVRRSMAVGLARLVTALEPFARVKSLDRRPLAIPANRLWPVPHQPRYDFEGTRAGAEWIDSLAGCARRIRHENGVGDRVLGHTDWRVQNMRFHGSRLTVAYDWDSLGTELEPELIGLVARAFTADWSIVQERPLPTPAEAHAFAREYQAARGVTFGERGDRLFRAALVYRIAYTARGEHSDVLTDRGRRVADPGAAPSSVPARTARAFLAEHGPELLGVSVDGVPPVGAASGPRRREP